MGADRKFNKMNIDNLAIRNIPKRRNTPLLPNSLRALVIGRSGDGKSNLVMNLLLKNGWLDYNYLYIFGNSLHQPEYQILKKCFERNFSKNQIWNLLSNQDFISPTEAIDHFQGKPLGGVTAEFFDDCALIPDPKNLDPKVKNLLILDDCYLGPQSKAGSYYSRGRHNNCNVIYISQNYFTLPRNSVRENSNILFLFKQNSKSVFHIFQDHVSGDMKFEEFVSLCKEVWKERYNFLTIDLTCEIKYGKYRKNLSEFYLTKDILDSNSDRNSSGI